MILNWGRKGLIAGAFAFSFVTPTSEINSLQTHNLQDGIPGQFTYQHITPPLAGVNTLQSTQLWGESWRFDFQYITPAEAPPIEEEEEGGAYRRSAMILIRKDIFERDYRLAKKRQGLRTKEITPKKVLSIIPKAETKTEIGRLIQQFEITRKLAREKLIAELQAEIEQIRKERIDQLNQQTLAMILAAVMADE